MDLEKIRQDTAVRAAEYQRRREDALKRLRELRDKLQRLEAKEARREVSRKDNMVEEGVPLSRE